MDSSRRVTRTSERSYEGTYGTGLDGDNSATFLSTATCASQDRSGDSETGKAHRSLQQARGVQRLQDRALSGFSGFLHQGRRLEDTAIVLERNVNVIIIINNLILLIF